MSTALLISGGVDSAVAVSCLLKEGHDLKLFYIRIGMEGQDVHCTAEEDIEMCTLIARKYGLELDVVDLHREYWDNVMAYALEEVRQGLTPNPDVMCNRMIKFGFFEKYRGHEFEYTATGHYATTLYDNSEKWLGTAVDPVKDQTDFLARITKEQLDKLIFPLGKMPKSQVREIAQRENLPNASRHDSQGICFLGKINYNDFLREQLGEQEGEIIDIETGKVLGKHKGYWFHTIGQRKGLGLGGGPWFVIEKDIENNRIYVSRGYDTELQFGRTLNLSSMHWITRNPFSEKELCDGVRVTFKNRHAPYFTPGILRCGEDGRRLILESSSKVQGIAPGQFGVIYDENSKICYGSGVIWKGTK
ncbi:MAG: tRNA 2-thiouridine(34) synthase MnmA [Muribaculaceae bacterium]|nr:tRNA 2-thiouridine(34) synthase MnmA [Muribaculaceae bacterium]